MVSPMKRPHDMKRVAMMLAFAASVLSARDGPRKLPLHVSWEMSLSSITGEDFGKRRGVIHPVEGLRYSPDGKWIAAVVGHAAGRPGPPSDVMLLPGDGDFRNVKRLPVTAEVESTPEAPGIW